MMYWEDRISLAGKHDEMVKKMEKFRKSKKTLAQQQDFYDYLCSIGVTSEEADEIVSLEVSEC